MGSIAFDHATAQALINALESADERVHHQSMQWSDTVDTAMDEFEGAYSRLFSSNASNEKRDRSEVCFHLLNVVRQVSYAQDDARADEERLAAVADWEQRYAAWQADADSDPSWWTSFTDPQYGGLMMSQPSQTPTRPPTIHAEVAVRDRDRVSSGSADTVSSASPSNLRSFVAIAERCHGIVEEELEALRTAWSGFRRNCSWVTIETFTLFDALAQYLEHARLEARWISQIADAFEVAGTGELSNEVLDALAPALHATAMSNTQLLQTLATADRAQLARLMNSSPALTHQLQLMDPATINAWWHRLAETPASNQQTALWETLPEVFGNLEGIPYHIRHQANQQVLDRKIADLEGQLQALAAERREALENLGHSPNQPQMVLLSLGARKRELEGQLAPLYQIDDSLTPDYGQAERQLISFTADAPPLAAISIGDLDTATNVTFNVAGMNSSTETMTGWTEATQNIHEKVTLNNANAATVAWIGYEAPVSPPGD